VLDVMVELLTTVVLVTTKLDLLVLELVAVTPKLVLIVPHRVPLEAICLALVLGLEILMPFLVLDVLVGLPTTVVLVTIKMVLPVVVLDPLTLKPVTLVAVAPLALMLVLLVMEHPPLTPTPVQPVIIPVQLALDQLLVNAPTVMLPLLSHHLLPVSVPPVM